MVFGYICYIFFQHLLTVFWSFLMGFTCQFPSHMWFWSHSVVILPTFPLTEGRCELQGFGQRGLCSAWHSSNHLDTRQCRGRRMCWSARTFKKEHHILVGAGAQRQAFIVSDLWARRQTLGFQQDWFLLSPLSSACRWLSSPWVLTWSSLCVYLCV